MDPPLTTKIIDKSSTVWLIWWFLLICLYLLRKKEPLRKESLKGHLSILSCLNSCLIEKLKAFFSSVIYFIWRIILVQQKLRFDLKSSKSLILSGRKINKWGKHIVVVGLELTASQSWEHCTHPQHLMEKLIQLDKYGSSSSCKAHSACGLPESAYKHCVMNCTALEQMATIMETNTTISMLQ